MTDDTLNPDETLPDEITAWVSPREEHPLHFWTCGVVAAHNRTQYVRKDIHDALRDRAEAAEAKLAAAVAMLKRIAHNIGWRGDPEDNIDLFCCEFCAAEAALPEEVPHHDECLIHDLRSTLAQIQREGTDNDG